MPQSPAGWKTKDRFYIFAAATAELLGAVVNNLHNNA